VTNDTVVQPPSQEEGVWITGPDGELVPDYDASFPEINEGEVVHGTVVRVDKDEVLVDIGYKSEGVIPVAELTIRRSVNPADEVSVGEEIDALVLTKEDAEGRLILSKKRARFELAWKNIERAAESGEPVDGRVIEVVKGGLILDLGVRGFLPASLVDIRRVQDLSEYVGQTISCRVIEMNRNRNNVVLSRRAVLEEERKEVRQQIIDELNVGDVVEGTISNIVDFGAFVDLDGIDGLIHISELSWTHINHPSEVLQVNQKVKVKVLDIDRDRQRISLGLKQTQADPWEQIVSEHNVGDVVEGRVTKIVAFGAFVEIYAGIEGLVHISELANRHVERPDEVVSVGQVVPVKIIEIDSDRRRLSLSIKRVAEGETPMQAGVLSGREEAREAEEVEEVAVVDAEVSEEEPLEALGVEEAVVVEDTPTLGLSDEVFPVGGDAARDAEVEAEGEQGTAAEGETEIAVQPESEADSGSKEDAVAESEADSGSKEDIAAEVDAGATEPATTADPADSEPAEEDA
jgi:small subunit ribosomal protein S1